MGRDCSGFFYLGWVVLVLLLIVDGLVEVVPQLPGVGPVGFHMARQEILKIEDIYGYGQLTFWFIFSSYTTWSRLAAKVLLSATEVLAFMTVVQQQEPLDTSDKYFF